MRRLVRAIAAAAIVIGPRALAAQTSTPVQSPAAPVSAAAESTLDANTRAVAAQLRCPVCQGLSLQDSPSELAQEMRTLVRQQLAAGRTQDEVRAYFVARYGEWILMAPEKHGFNWLVYALPLLVLVGGAWVLITALRRWTITNPSDGKASQSGGTRTLL